MVTLTPASSSKMSSGPGKVRQSISVGFSGTFRANSQCMRCVTARGAPKREVPVSAMATQSPSSQSGRRSPATMTPTSFNCQYPSSGLCTGTHCKSLARRRLSWPPKEISLGTLSLRERKYPKVCSVRPFILDICPKKLNSGSTAKLARPKPNTPSNSKVMKGSLVISLARITRSSVQSLRGVVMAPGVRQTVSRTNSPVTSPVPKAMFTWSRRVAFFFTGFPS
mmetsp:Transcript_73621/g.117102  ORF Transcript_73621/g.117102 Transcript_73621/m.117102 type:complete len:224 (-) Transcript_73621:403-1074(-)